MKAALEYIHKYCEHGTDSPVPWWLAGGFLALVLVYISVAFSMGLELYAVLALMGGVLFIAVLQSEVVWVLVVILGYLPIFWQGTKELSIMEILHAILFYGGLLWWFFHRIVILRKSINWSIGGIMYVLFMIQIVVMIPVSLMNGADSYVLTREIVVIGSPLLFIPISNAFTTHARQKLLVAALLPVLLSISIKNIVMYRQKLLNVVAQWEVGASRQSEGYFLIFVLAVIAFSLLVSSHRIRMWLPAAFMFVISAFAAIITFYRTIWVAILIGLAVMGFYLGKKYWKRASAYFALSLVVGYVVFFSFFGEVISLKAVTTSITARFISVEKYFNDPSIKNRNIEARAALKKMDKSIILGTGLATTVRYHNFFTKRINETSWTHNGYPWMLFHFGIVGSILLLGSYLFFYRKGVLIIRHLATRKDLPARLVFQWQALAAAGVAVTVGLFAISVTINQFYGAQPALIFAVIWGMFEVWSRELKIIKPRSSST